MQIRWQCSSCVQSGVAFSLLSQQCLPVIKTSQPCGEDETLYYSRYLHSLLFFAFDNIITKARALQLKASDCWQRGLNSNGSRQGWGGITTKVLLERNCAMCFNEADSTSGRLVNIGWSFAISAGLTTMRWSGCCHLSGECPWNDLVKGRSATHQPWISSC